MPDEALVRAVNGGDQRAYEQLILRHQDMVARFIWRLVPVPEDREEVCQDVFVKAYMNLSKFKFDAKFSTWLYSIAYRTAISFLRKRKYETEEFEDNDPAPGTLADEVEDEETARLVQREISRLDPEERGIVTLYHVQGCGVDEIAEIMARPAGTIKSILFRVRKKLKQRLQSSLGERENEGA